jgi:3-oxoacyl-[acyl-carrier protein] reductase
VKKACIIGASSAIGLSLIRQLDGVYDEILCHYNSHTEGLELLKSQLKTPLTLIQADLSDEASTLAFADTLHNDPDIDAIVHISAPGLELKPFKKEQWSDFQRMLNVQVRSAVLTLQAVLPAMVRAKHGRIVMVLTAAIDGKNPAYMTSYLTAKHALHGLMKSLSSEYVSKGITVNAVSPSMTDTPFIAQMPELAKTMQIERHPMHRLATVEDIVPAITYFLSDESGYISGQNLVISGGEH